MLLLAKKEYALKMKLIIISIWFISLEMIFRVVSQLYTEEVIDNILNNQFMINILLVILAIRLVTLGSFARTIILVWAYLTVFILAFVFGSSYNDSTVVEIPLLINDSIYITLSSLFTIFILSTKEAMSLYKVKNKQRDFFKTLLIVFGFLLLFGYFIR